MMRYRIEVSILSDGKTLLSVKRKSTFWQRIGRPVFELEEAKKIIERDFRKNHRPEKTRILIGHGD